MLLLSVHYAQSILTLLTILSSIHAAPNPVPKQNLITQKFGSGTITVGAPNPHLLHSRGIPSDTDISALRYTLQPDTPGWEMDTMVFSSTQENDPLNPVVAKHLTALYEQVVAFASTAPTETNGYFQANIGNTHLEMQSTVVQNGVNVPSGFLGFKMVQAFGKKMLEWTKRNNLYGHYVIFYKHPATGIVISITLWCGMFGGLIKRDLQIDG